MVFTARRFWLDLLLLALISVIWTVSVDFAVSIIEFLDRYILVVAVAFAVDVVMVLWAEEQQNKRKAVLIRIGMVLSVAGYVGLLLWLMPPNWGWQFICLCAAMVLVMPFAVVFQEENDVPVFHFIERLVVMGMKVAIGIGVFVFGTCFLIYIIFSLFQVEIFSLIEFLLTKAMMVAMVRLVPWGVVLLFFVSCCCIPHGAAKHDHRLRTYKFFKGLMLYVVLPFLIIYLFVLWGYLLYIVFRWELPQGVVSQIVTGVMALYLLCYVLLYPYLVNKSGKLYVLMHKVLPLCILPLLGLMTVGVARRVSDYGITIERLYLITVLVWYYAVCIVIPCLRSPRFRWIFVSAAVVIFLTSAQPMDYHQICKRILVSEIKHKIADGTPSEDKQLREKIAYVEEQFGAEALKGVLKE